MFPWEVMCRINPTADRQSICVRSLSAYYGIKPIVRSEICGKMSVSTTSEETCGNSKAYAVSVTILWLNRSQGCSNAPTPRGLPARGPRPGLELVNAFGVGKQRFHTVPEASCA